MSQITENTVNQSDLLLDKWKNYNAAEAQFIQLRKKLIHQIMTMQIRKGVDLFSQLQKKLESFEKSDIFERIIHSLTTGQCVKDIHMKYVQENIHIVSNNTQKVITIQLNAQDELNSIDNKVQEYEFENKKLTFGQKLQSEEKKQKEMKLQSKQDQQVWKQSQQAPNILEKPDQNQTQQTTNNLFETVNQEKIQNNQTMKEKREDNLNQQSPIVLNRPTFDIHLTEQLVQKSNEDNKTQQTMNNSVHQNVQLGTPVEQVVKEKFQENQTQKIADDVSVQQKVQNPLIQQQTALIVPSQQNSSLENKQEKNGQNNDSEQQKQDGDDNDQKQKKKKKNKKKKKKNNIENILQNKTQSIKENSISNTGLVNLQENVQQKKAQQGDIIQSIDQQPEQKKFNLENKIQEQEVQKKQIQKEQKVESKPDKNVQIKTQNKNQPKNGKPNQQTNAKQTNPQPQQNQQAANTNKKKKK